MRLFLQQREGGRQAGGAKACINDDATRQDCLASQKISNIIWTIMWSKWLGRAHPVRSVHNIRLHGHSCSCTNNNGPIIFYGSQQLRHWRAYTPVKILVTAPTTFTQLPLQLPQTKVTAITSPLLFLSLLAMVARVCNLWKKSIRSFLPSTSSGWQEFTRGSCTFMCNTSSKFFFPENSFDSSTLYGSWPLVTTRRGIVWPFDPFFTRPKVCVTLAQDR